MKWVSIRSRRKPRAGSVVFLLYEYEDLSISDGYYESLGFYHTNKTFSADLPKGTRIVYWCQSPPVPRRNSNG